MSGNALTMQRVPTNNGPMAAPPVQDLSLAGLLAALFALLAPPEVVAHLVTLGGICIGWLFGLLVALMRRPPNMPAGRLFILAYGAASLLGSMVLAGPLAMYLANHLPWGNVGAQALLAPVTASLVSVGHSWSAVLPAIGKSALSRIKLVIGGATPSGSEKNDA